MVSEWMANGNINQYVKAHQDANRFKLVGFTYGALLPSPVAEISITPVARRRCKGPDLSAHLGNDPWGSEGGASLKAGTSFLSLTGLHRQDNILVDGTGNARLTDFGLLTIHLDSTTTTSHGGGSSRWMSPELFDPERFGVEDSRRTKSSDCYALGMVVYEVLTGQVPFSGVDKYPAISKVLQGERPERPQGLGGKWFTDDIWGILGRCWESKSWDRPSIECVLEHLEEASTIWTPLPSLMEEDPQQLCSPTWSLSELSIW